MLRNLVDLERFELSTSSMPFKKYQSLTDSLTKNITASGKHSLPATQTVASRLPRLLVEIDHSLDLIIFVD